jgi:hypothetical protein
MHMNQRHKLLASALGSSQLIAAGSGEALGFAGLLLLVLAGATTACGGLNSTPGATVVADSKGGVAGTGAGGAPAAVAGGPSGVGGSLELTPIGDGPEPDRSSQAGGGGVGGGCAATFVQAKVKTLAMFIMLDQSKSMDQVVDAATMTTRWGAVTGAFASFVSNPATADIPVGLQYFGLPTTMGGFGFNDSCTVSDYAKPEVAIAPLSMNAKPIIDSMAAHAPQTTTPTLPAVQGGIQFATSYATAHPENNVVLVLATDGEPSGCNSTVDSVTAAAAVGLNGMPPVKTYVIGVGNNLSNLDAIAVAGGTQHAFLVSDANVQQDLVQALTAIQGTVVPCQYSVPLPNAGKALDFGKVNVQFTPTVGTPQEFQNVPTATDCPASGDFWYYDNNTAPTQILLCENTCKRLTNVTAGKVEIVLDCKETIVKPPT